MGKTVESYRLALEDEINTWSGFARALRIDDRDAFDVLMDACRNHASAASNATRPMVLEPMIMCIALTQQKEIRRLQKQVAALKNEVESLEQKQSQL